MRNVVLYIFNPLSLFLFQCVVKGFSHLMHRGKRASASIFSSFFVLMESRSKKSALCMLHEQIQKEHLRPLNFEIAEMCGAKGRDYVATVTLPNHEVCVSPPMPSKSAAKHAAAEKAMLSSWWQSSHRSLQQSQNTPTTTTKSDTKAVVGLCGKQDRDIAAALQALCTRTSRSFPFSLINKKPIQCHGPSVERGPRLMSLDCETVVVAGNTRCLARVTLVQVTWPDRPDSIPSPASAQHKLILDEFVRPPSAVLDYGISGVTPGDLQGATLTCSTAACRRVASCIAATDYLVGHGIHHDFNYLSLHHKRVIDTACLFRYARLRRSLSLGDIYTRLFGEPLYVAGSTAHSSEVDARACLRIVLHEMAAYTQGRPFSAPFARPPDDQMCTLMVSSIPLGTLPDDILSLFPPTLIVRLWHPVVPSGIRFEAGKAKGACRLTFTSYADTKAAFLQLEGPTTYKDGGALLVKHVSVGSQDVCFELVAE